MIRELIIARLEDIKAQEEGFISESTIKDWESNFVTFEKDSVIVTDHIVGVKFDELNELDLMKIFEYVILSRDQILRSRVKETYNRNLKIIQDNA